MKVLFLLACLIASSAAFTLCILSWGEKIPDDTDNRYYYVCDWLFPIRKRCPGDMIFDPSYCNCVSPRTRPPAPRGPPPTPYPPYPPYPPFPPFPPYPPYPPYPPPPPRPPGPAPPGPPVPNGTPPKVDCGAANLKDILPDRSIRRYWWECTRYGWIMHVCPGDNYCFDAERGICVRK